MGSLRPLIAIMLVGGAACLAACSSVDHAIVVTENGASRMFDASGSTTPPRASLDPQALKWQQLHAASPVQFAVLSGASAKAGTTEVALKVPAGEAIPAFWQDVPVGYTVMSGTFVIEGIDSLGLPQHSMQAAGISARVPARMIQKMRSTAAGDGVLLLTVYGDWKPNFVEDDRSGQTQRAAN